MSSEFPLLSLVIWLPIIGGLLVLAAGKNDVLVRWLALRSSTEKRSIVQR